MSIIANLVTRMTGDERPLVKASVRARRAVNDFGRFAGRAAKNTALLGAGAGVAAAAGLAVMARQSADNVDRLQKLASNLDSTAAEAQQLEFVANLTGVGAGNMSKAVQQVTRVLGDAAGGSKSAQKAFSALGLDLEELKKQSPIDRFRTVLEQMGKMPNSADRASTGALLLGRAWRDIKPAIDGGSDAFKQAEKVFVGAGLGLGKSAASVEKLNDEFETTKQIGAALRDQVFSQLAEKAAPLVTQFNNWALAQIEAAGGGEKLADIISTKLLQQLDNMQQRAKGLLEFAKAVQSFGSAVGSVGSFLARGLGGAFATAGAIGRGEFSGAATAFSSTIDDQLKALTGGDDGKEAKQQRDELLQLTKLQVTALQTLAATPNVGRFG